MINSEAILLILQIIFIPVIKSLINNEINKLKEEFKIKLEQHYHILENLTKHNTNKINHLKDNIEHQNIIANLKYQQTLQDLEEVENFLKKQNNFIIRDRSKKDYKLF